MLKNMSYIAKEFLILIAIIFGIVGVATFIDFILGKGAADILVGIMVVTCISILIYRHFKK